MNKQMVEAVTTLLAKYRVEVLHDGNYTLCLVADKKNPTLDKLKAFSIAKRNPNLDKMDEEIGANIVIARATRKLMFGKKKK